MFSRRPLLGMYSSTQKHASAVAGLEKVVEVVLAAVNWLSSIEKNGRNLLHHELLITNSSSGAKFALDDYNATKSSYKAINHAMNGDENMLNSMYKS